MNIKDYSYWRLTFCCATVSVFLRCCGNHYAHSSPRVEQPIILSSNIHALKGREDDYALYTAFLDGRLWRRLTSLNDDSYHGSYSPDGKKVVYMAIIGKRNNDICTIDADGANKKVLTTNDDWDGEPSYSPDGKRILYVEKSHGYRIILMDESGGNKRALGPVFSDASSPVFSPDGKTIVFSAKPISHDPSGGRYSGGGSAFVIYTMNADGSALKSLAGGDSPTWSHDGKRIVFVLGGGLWLLNRVTGQTRQLTLGGSGDDLPSFSPDDRSIVFSSYPSRRSARGTQLMKGDDQGKIDIYLTDIAGRITKRLTQGNGRNVSPSWNPRALQVDTSAFLRQFVRPLAPKVIPVVSSNAKLAVGDVTLLSHIFYAYNDLQKAPYPSFLLEHQGDKSAAFRVRGLEGTEGDFVFDPLVLPGGIEALVKLGDPVARPGNPYNSYRLWKWNRGTNQFKQVGTRSLFFPSVAVSPDGKRVAYVGGGDAEGAAGADNPLRLYVFDFDRQKETLVAQNDGVRGGFAWLNTQTLLYTAFPQLEAQEGDEPLIRPNLLKFDVTTQQSQLFLRDGSHPTPSPDGKRIAFFGMRQGEKTYALPDEWWIRPGIASLAVVGADGSGRKTYGTRSGPFPSVVWSSDGRLIYFVRQTAFGLQARADVGAWNVENDLVHSVTDLSAHGDANDDISPFHPRFRALGLGRDGTTLIVAVADNVNQSNTTHTFQAIGLQKSGVTKVAQLRNDAGFDWQP